MPFNRSIFLINNAFMRTEGTECFPVLPFQPREQVTTYFFCTTEIASSLENIVSVSTELSSSDWYYALLSVASAV